MAKNAAFDDGHEPDRRWLWIVLGIVALAAIAYGIWMLSTAKVGKPKPAPPSTTALLLPPPPPPPPPPPQEKPPEPTETTKPVPVDVPTPTPAKAEAPAAIAVDAAPTGAGDSFGLQGGPGGMGGVGSMGTGTGAAGSFSDGFYRQNLRNALQQRIQDDDRVNHQVFSADFSVWVDGGGRLTKAELVRTSGDTKRDQQLLAILLATAGLDTPPASIRFPARITVRGRKSSL